ncbi:hypothetical protein BGZ49_005048 [Haplosporangium sp. Z 27]|nr:hypothetical protein BGZ49_005048 [Haplosporangium sp. Z 27]
MGDQSSQYGAPSTLDKRRRISFRSASSTTSNQRAQSSIGNLSDGDIVDALEVMMPNQAMGDVLKIKKEWLFSCVVSGEDIGELFTNYFQSCCLEPYKHAFPEDALALSATLLLKKSSRSPRMLKTFGGQRLNSFAADFIKSTIPPLDANLLNKQRELVLKWVSCLNFAPGDRHEISSRRKEIAKRLMDDWNEAEEADLSGLHLYFLTSVQNLFVTQPKDFQESDGISSFIRNLLVAFLQEPDLNSYDKASEASLYNKRINHILGTSKHPDLVGIFGYEGVSVETFFGEASSVCTPNASKYGGDTVRLGVFGKNSHDMLDNLADERIPLLLFNIDGLVLQAFAMHKIQDIYVMAEIGTARIPCSINDLLFISQDLPFWLQLRALAKRSSSSMEAAVDAGNIDWNRKKKFYSTMTTPSAREALRASKE